MNISGKSTMGSKKKKKAAKAMKAKSVGRGAKMKKKKAAY